MPAARFRTHGRVPEEAGPPATSRSMRTGTGVGHTHGAAGDAELSGQIAPRGEPRARGEPPVLDALSDRPIDLGSQRDPSGAIELDGEGSHRAMVQPRSAILVLFYGQAQRICSP